MWAWGCNYYGQLGDGTTVNKNIPTKIGTATNWSKIEASSDFTLSIKKDNTLWAWGNNTNGQLGDGTTVNKNSPIQIGIATNWSKISAGSGYTLATKTNGTLWAWGANSEGNLGNGTRVDKNIPTQIGTETTWSDISAGDSHSKSLKTDSLLWSWGNNSYGEIGDGTLIDKNIPSAINCPTLSLNDFSENKINIYPNPAKNFIDIQTSFEIKKAYYQVYDLLCKKVVTKINNNQINISELTNGIYLLKVKSEGKTTNHKFIKE